MCARSLTRLRAFPASCRLPSAMFPFFPAVSVRPGAQHTGRGIKRWIGRERDIHGSINWTVGDWMTGKEDGGGVVVHDIPSSLTG